MRRLNYKIIIFLLGILILINGVFMLLVALISRLYSDGVTNEITLSGIIICLAGFILMFFFRTHKKDITKRDSYAIVTSSWLIMILIATTPYFTTGVVDNFTDAFFEAVSGYTTTGATIFNNIEQLPKSILFWRSLTHWIGGMGIIVLAIAILPLLGIGGMQLFVAEAPGLGGDKLHPKITDTAKQLWLIYVSFTLLESLLLKIAGMPWFDAINHSMSTVSTGGFSTKNMSLGHWNDTPLIQYIVIAFMFLGGTNYILPYYLIKRKTEKIFKNEEFRWYLFFVVTISLITTVVIYINVHGRPFSAFDYQISDNRIENGFRHGLFQVISVITTTGFVTADFTNWTPFLKLCFFILMFLGGCSGSTTGGIKLVRHIVMLKSAVIELKKAINPNAVILMRYNGYTVPQKIIYHVLAFLILYLLTFIAGVLLLSILRLDFETAVGVSISSLSNIGPAFGTFNPLENFQEMPKFGKWVCSSLMILGRLELFTVIILFTPYFWKK